jgi:hypothetical protein
MTPLILRQAQDEREGAADHAYAAAHTYRQAGLRHQPLKPCSYGRVVRLPSPPVFG